MNLIESMFLCNHHLVLNLYIRYVICTFVQATSTFHGTALKDYQGRSWVEPPSGCHPDESGEHECFIPKKCVRKLTGHSKGVQALEFFPKTGDNLLCLICIDIKKITHCLINMHCVIIYYHISISRSH